MSRIRSFVGLAAVAIFVATASLAQAQNGSYWSGATGNWTDATWTSATFNVNAAADCPAYITTGSVINNGGTVTINSTVTDPYGNGFTFIGGSDFIAGAGFPGGSGYVNLVSGGIFKAPAGVAQQEALGVASGSGIFTQSGGINCPYQQGSGAAGYSYNSIALGWSKGGYGEYDLSGGSVGANAIFVGGNSVPTFYSSPTISQCGTGVFNQTGGSVGASAAAGPIMPSV